MESMREREIETERYRDIDRDIDKGKRTERKGLIELVNERVWDIQTDRQKT